MIRTVYRRPDAAATPAAVFDPDALLLIDELDGETPTWRMTEQPIYDECVRDLGDPGSLVGPAPSTVVAGEVIDPVEAPPTIPIPIRPTTAIPVTGRGGRKRRQPSARRAAS